MTKLKNKKMLLFDFILLSILVVFDQYSKYWAIQNLKDKPPIPIWEGVLELQYLENRGAAFGILQDQKIFFLFIAIIFLGIIGYVLCKTPVKKKFNIFHILLTVISAGAIGNMIDRARLDYVVDFIYFNLIDFPIFNVADIYVSVATAILLLLLLFVYKEDDLGFLTFKEKKYREIQP